MRLRILLGFILGLVAATALFGTLAAFGQTDKWMSRLHPVIVNIEQEVPLVADVPLETTDGIVTTTVPMTLNLALKISLTSALPPAVTAQASTPKVSVEASSQVQGPGVSITNTETSIPTNAVELRDLAWRITKQENLGHEFAWNSLYSFTSTGNYIRLNFAIENIGNTPVKLSPYDRNAVEARLIDGRGREFDEMDYNREFEELCRYAQINPGLTANCVMVFDVPTDVKSLLLRLSEDDRSVEIPLTMR